MHENFSRRARHERGLEQHIKNVVSFEDLYINIDKIGEVPGPEHLSKYSPEMLREAIEHVRNGRMEPRFITDAYGIRNKVEELLADDPVYIEARLKDPRPDIEL